MIASLVAPILWLGALERFSRWQTNRNPPAGGALLTAVALALMVTIDTPVSIEALGRLDLSEYEVVTVERVLLLVACYGALVFAFALDNAHPHDLSTLLDRAGIANTRADQILSSSASSWFSVFPGAATRACTSVPTAERTSRLSEPP